VPLAIGTYYVRAERVAVPNPATPGVTGSGCFTAPQPFTILDKAARPMVTLSSVSNTACDGNFDGQITAIANSVRVIKTGTISTVSGSGTITGAGTLFTTDFEMDDLVYDENGVLIGRVTAIASNTSMTVTPAATSTKTNVSYAGGPGNNATYSFAWTVPVAPAGINIGAQGPFVGATANGDASFITASTDEVGPGTYSLVVNNTINGCTANGTVALTTITIPMEIVDVTPTNVDVCLPMTPNGTGTVVDVKVGASTGQSGLFNFTWDDNADMLTPFVTANPALTQNNLDLGTYYVRGERSATAGPAVPGITGSGCKTAAVPFVIDEDRQYPFVSFELEENTSCDNNFDGEITVLASTTGFTAATLYDFDWTSVPAGVTAGDALNVVSPHTTGGTDLIGPGAYNITVTNKSNMCSSTGTTTLVTNPQVLEILTVNKTDQMICNPDGSVTVQSLSTGTPVNYSFTWFRDTPSSTPLVDGTSTTIVAPAIDKTNYLTMGASPYFVVATRNASLTPGSGCSTPPFRQDVLDLHKDPRVTFSSIANSACTDAKANGSITAVASEQTGPAGTYTFAWTAPGVVAPVNNTTTSVINNALDGDYVLVATNTTTGCDVSGGYNLVLDETRSTPNIIEVITVDPLDCLGSGSAEVTKITLGSTFNSRLQPPQIPPNNEVTGAGLLAFEFKWFRSNVDPTSQLRVGGPAVTTPAITGLDADNYYVFVLDPTTDCQSAPKEVVILPDDIIYPEVNIVQNKLQVACDPALSSGELIATADINKPVNSRTNFANYEFYWYANLDTIGSALNVVSDTLVSNLAVGDYSVKVHDLTTNCRASTFYIVPDDGPNFKPVLSLTVNPRYNCLSPDGALLVRETAWNPSSGYPFNPPSFTPVYYFGPSPDTNGAGTGMTNAPPSVPGPNLNWRESGLDFGTYTVKMTDNNTGCVTIEAIEIEDKRTPPLVAIVEDNPLINCDPARPNGQLTATADEGQVVGYSFEWYTDAPPTGSVLTTENTLIGQTAGFYTVRVTNDFTGCSDDEAGEITDGTVDAPTPTAVLIQDNAHCLVPEGWVAASVGGVTLNYEFKWFNDGVEDASPDFIGVDYYGLDQGIYGVTATDIATGCDSPIDTVKVTNRQVIPELFFETKPSFCDELPGSGGRGNGQIILTFKPTEVLTDSVLWFFQGNVDNDILDPNLPKPGEYLVGIGSYVNDILPGQYYVQLETSKKCPAEGMVVVKTEILSYNLVTVNSDGKNDNFKIDCITRFPNNNVKIFNRSGVMVYEADGYNNNDIVFTGVGTRGVYAAGNELPVGTYFYVIDKRDGSKPKTGYIELVK
jgi:gliding motility-associated-like protein